MHRRSGSVALRASLIVALLAGASGCVVRTSGASEPSAVPISEEHAVQRSAEEDLDCASDEINVGAIDGDEAHVYVATGCGRSAHYRVSCTSSSRSLSSHGETCTAYAIDEDDGDDE